MRQTGLQVKTNGHFSLFDIEVIPIGVPTFSRRCFIILFEDYGAASASATSASETSASETSASATGSSATGAVPARPSSRKIKPVPAESLPLSPEHAREIARLSQELSATKAYLQSVIEAKQAGNEQLKAANEEISSSNEELQRPTKSWKQPRRNCRPPMKSWPPSMTSRRTAFASPPRSTTISRT